MTLHKLPIKCPTCGDPVYTKEVFGRLVLDCNRCVDHFGGYRILETNPVVGGGGDE